MEGIHLSGCVGMVERLKLNINQGIYIYIHNIDMQFNIYIYLLLEEKINTAKKTVKIYKTKKKNTWEKSDKNKQGRISH